MNKKSIVSLFFLGFISNALADNALIGNGFICHPAAYQLQGKNIVLSSVSDQKKSIVYLFHNKSSQSIWIDHPNPDPGASAGWASYIRPNNWSALVMNKKNFAIDCAMIQPGKLVYLDCSQILEVCVPEKITSSFKGNFWLAEDQPFDVFSKTLEKKGVIA